MSSTRLLRRFLNLYVSTGRVQDLDDCLRDSPAGRAAINSLGSDTLTLLGTAARRGDVACCRVLLQHGAEPEGLPGQARTPLDLAEEGGNPEVVGLIRRALSPASPPPAELPEIDFDLGLGFCIGPIEEEAPIVVNEPPPAVWAELCQRSQKHDQSAPVAADVELALDLDALFFHAPDEFVISGLPQDVPERLRSVVTASLVDGRVRLAALADAFDRPRSEREEARTLAIVHALAARIAQAGALEADDVWEAADPLRMEQPAAPRWDGGVNRRRESRAGGAFELPELFVDPLHDAGLDLPINEVLAAVDDLGVDTEAAWWTKATRARARQKSGSEDVLHSRLALEQAQLVIGVGRWLDSLPPVDQAAAHVALLAGGEEIDGSEAEGTIHADDVQEEPQVAERAANSTADGAAKLGEHDHLRAALDGHRSEVPAFRREASQAKGRQLPPLGRNTMEVWLPRLRLLDTADPAGRRFQLPPELLDSAALIRGLMEELTEQHLPLVRDLVSTWRWAPVDVDDLIQQGNLGLWRALYTFNPEEASFGAYAHWWIRARITRYIRADGDLHLSSGLAERASSFEEALDWRRRSQPEAGLTDVATWLELDVESVWRTMDSMALAEGRLSWEDLDEAEHPPSGDLDTAVELAFHADADALRRALAQLGPREQQILEMRFGLGGDEGARLSEIGVAVNLSRERVRQIETKALERVRSLMVGGSEDPPRPGRRRGPPARVPVEPTTTSEDPLPVAEPKPHKPVVVTMGTDRAAKSDRQRMDKHGR